MKKTTFIQAIRAALYEEMCRDDSVFLMGEDISSNLLGTTEGFVEKFGRQRVIDTPISEASFTGLAAGAAMVGMRPVVDFMMSPFMYLALDQIINTIAKSRYLYGGQAKVPIVLRSSMAYGVSLAAQHSDRPYSLYMHIPGLKVIVPSCAYDMKGLLKAAIRDDNPVVCFQDSSLSTSRSDIPDDDFIIPLGKAVVKRVGADVTVVGIGATVQMSLSVAEELSNEGISVEVVDLMTINPLDRNTILESVGKTGRLVVADVGWRTCSASSEIAATVVSEGFDSLRAPIKIITTPDTHIPFAPTLEQNLYPNKDKIKSAILEFFG